MHRELTNSLNPSNYLKHDDEYYLLMRNNGLKFVNDTKSMPNHTPKAPPGIHGKCLHTPTCFNT